MAAVIKALNAKIRANPVSDYLCSTRKSAFPAFISARVLPHDGRESAFNNRLLESRKPPRARPFP